MKSRIWVVLMAAGVCGLAACTSPEARIKRNPEAFARLTAGEQALVKAGKVGVGFDEEMVRLAVGEPDRKWERTEASGVSEIWSYTLWENAGGAPLYRGWYHRYYDPAPMYYLNWPDRREHEFYRVVLKGGRVTAVEEETR